MSYRGNPRGRGDGGFRGGRGGGSFGRGGSRGGYQQSYGPPAAVSELGSFVHACEGEMVCESNNPKIPHFNAPIYLENKTPIGKLDEILGPINQVYFTIKPQEGIVATSFKSGDKFYIAGEKLLPLERFLPKPKPPPGTLKPKRAGGAGRGPRGAARGGGRGFGRGAPRGGARGGSGFSRGGGRGAPRSGGFSGGRGAPRGGGGFSRGAGFRGGRG